jgi:predicted MFS family arabinose efflux permease
MTGDSGRRTSQTATVAASPQCASSCNSPRCASSRYNQPLLSSIARSFHATPRAAGAIATLTQAGYAVGLLLFVPLGDIVERRRLIALLLCLVAGALLIVGLGPALSVVMVASFAVGVTTVVPQLLLPFAAGLAPPAMRGRIVGQVVSGLLVGILAGRAVAGVVGDVAGWCAMYLAGSAAMLLLGHTLCGLAVGVLLLDAATQAAQVSNQTRVYALRTHAHNRLNTIYMVGYFIGGATGSALAVVAWAAFRWPGVCAVALGSPLTAYAIYFARRNEPGL